MQTFLPFPDFDISARILDNKRLGKQRVETMQLMTALTGIKIRKGDDRLIRTKKAGWTRHPAALMWEGHTHALMRYQEAVCIEWTTRGFMDTCLEKTQRIHRAAMKFETTFVHCEDNPHWVGDKKFHLSHQGNLVRKDEEYYWPKMPWADPEVEYVWPVPF